MLTLHLANLAFVEQVPNPYTVCVVGCEEQAATLAELHAFYAVETVRRFLKKFPNPAARSQVPKFDTVIFVADCKSIYVLRHKLNR